MSTLKSAKFAVNSVSRTILGTLLLAFGLFVCPYLSEAHVSSDTSKQLETLLETLPSESLPETPLKDAPEAGEPQFDRFDAVEDTQPALVEASRDWRLDAALARTHSHTSLSETLSNGGQTSARPSKNAVDATASDMPTHAAGPSAPVLPQRMIRPAALPIGTPACFLPAERGLVAYPTPPPFGC